MLVDKQDFKRVLTEAETFPALPQNVNRILILSNSSETSLKGIGDVILQDASLATRFLRMVNSSYYGLAHEVTDIHQAVSLLGGDVIRDIAITLSLMDVFPIRQAKEYEILFEESLTAAIAADLIMQVVHRVQDSGVFLAALLTNLGAFVFMRYLPDSYFKLIQEARKRRLDLRAVERLYLGLDQLEAARLIVQRWNLPLKIRKCFSQSFDRLRELDENERDDSNHICIYAKLGKLAAEIFYQWNVAEKIARFKNEMEDFFDISSETAEDVLSALPQTVNDSGFKQSIGFQPLPDFQRVQRIAEEELIVNHQNYEATYAELFSCQERIENLQKEKKKLENDLNHCQTLLRKVVSKLKKK